MGKLIAITSGMAAEKSTLLQQISNSKKAVIISVDDIIKKATNNPELLLLAADVFYPEGCAVYMPTSNGQIVFNYASVRSYILESKENFIHWQRFWCNKVQDQWLTLQSKHEIVVVEFPMLFESGLEYQFDKIIFVETLWRKRMERFIERGYTAKDFWDRERIHYSTNWKKEHSDLVVNGNLLTYPIEEILAVY